MNCHLKHPHRPLGSLPALLPRAPGEGLVPGWLEHTGLSPWRPREEPSGWAAGRSARDMLVCLCAGLGSHPPGSWVF